MIDEFSRPVLTHHLNGKWCRVVTGSGKELFQGWFSSCWRLVKNLKESQSNFWIAGLIIEQIEYSAKKYIKGV